MRQIRLGLAGGGPGAFIGPVHRIAAELDREIELVAGAFSSDAERSRQAGAAYGVAPDRAYPSVEVMIAAERQRSDGIELLAIATPNHLHLAAARAGLEAGLAVLSDKPPTATLQEAEALAEIVARTGGLYGLTYTYTGYPMVREARARIAAGELGAVRKVVVEYLQGWLAEPIENQGHKQAAWRVDPDKAGQGGCIGDVGVHAFNLAEFVVGDEVEMILPDLAAVVAGRALDDDATVLLRFARGARGVLVASQIATGERNHLRLRVWGEKGGLEWSHETCDRLSLVSPDGAIRTVFGGSAAVGSEAAAASRLPAGHPEGYLEAFANLYRDFAAAMRGDGRGLTPGIAEGLRSMRFVAAAVEGRGWTSLKTGA